MIKLLVFLVSACVLNVAMADEAAARNIRDNAVTVCKSELNVNDDVANVLGTNQMPKTETEACFLDCVMKKIGWIKDGKVDHDAFMNLNKIRYENNQQKIDEAEKVYAECVPEVEKRSSEKCGGGIGMRACIIKFFGFNV